MYNFSLSKPIKLPSAFQVQAETFELSSLVLQSSEENAVYLVLQSSEDVNSPSVISDSREGDTMTMTAPNLSNSSSKKPTHSCS